MLQTILFVDDRLLHRWQVEFRVLRAWRAAQKETSWQGRQGPYIVSWSNLISHSCCCNPTWPPWWWGSYHWRHGANLLPCPCLCSMIVGRWILAWFNEPNSMQVAGSLRWWFNIYYTIYIYINPWHPWVSGTCPSCHSVFARNPHSFREDHVNFHQSLRN